MITVASQEKKKKKTVIDLTQNILMGRNLLIITIFFPSVFIL